MALDRSLSTPVQYLRGVGPQKAPLWHKLGVQTARDMVFLFPRDYQDLTELSDASSLVDGDLVRLRGEVREVEFRSRSRERCMLGVLLAIPGANLRLIWFNQPYLEHRFREGQSLLVTGRVRMRGLVWEIAHPQTRHLAVDTTAHEPLPALLPVYPLTEGLHQAGVRAAVHQAVEEFVDQIDEVFPDDYLAAHKLVGIRDALRQIHAPLDRAVLAAAQRRLIYQELLILQLALAVKRRQQRDLRQAPPLPSSARIDARIRRLFPFPFTAGQNQVLLEITADLAQAHPMQRLLHGEVGSGKTVVAVYVLLVAVANGQQAVLMAPTEILARQHALTLGNVLAASSVRWLLLTGGQTPNQRRDALARIAGCEVDLVIGTQAVVQDDVQFARLGLVVIDEQHKFGVRQRASLRQAGQDPHYLVMTATPIPRTMAMTQFGDLDVSTLSESPPGRQPVHSYVVDEAKRNEWWSFCTKKLSEGRQGYVVVPLVEDSDTIQAMSLDAAYEALANGPLEAFRLALLHGRLQPQEKDQIMADFRAGKTQVLVSTTVVEVGVDVPNATLMTILAAERFGLAQLHQLRGRISRGRHPGFCAIFAETPSPEALARLEAFTGTNDGFRLAELDFALRGPGDLFGTKQHGLPPLRIADLRRDRVLLEEARRDAQTLVALDPGLSLPQHERLRRMVLARYGRVLELGDVG